MLKLYRGNVKDGQFPYNTHYPVSLNGLQIFDRAKPNKCYIVLKEDIPEGKLLNGIVDEILILIDDSEYISAQLIKTKLENMAEIYEAQDELLKAMFEPVRKKFNELCNVGEFEKAKSMLTSPYLDPNLISIANLLLAEMEAE